MWLGVLRSLSRVNTDAATLLEENNAVKIVKIETSSPEVK